MGWLGGVAGGVAAHVLLAEGGDDHPPPDIGTVSWGNSLTNHLLQLLLQRQNISGSSIVPPLLTI